MRAVVQRVSDARVLSEGVLTGEIQKGLMVLLGVEDGDTQADGDYIAQKLLGLRIFEDEKGVPNLDISHGSLPNGDAGKPHQCRPLYHFAGQQEELLKFRRPSLRGGCRILF